MRNALPHAGKSSRTVVSAFMATAFAQASPEAAEAQWRKVADQLRPKLPKLASFMDEAEGRGARLHGLPRRSLVEASLDQRPRTAQWRDQAPDRGRRHLSQRRRHRRLVGAILLEQNDEWAIQRARYITLETIAALSEDPIVGLPVMVIWPIRPIRKSPWRATLHHA